jgi:hypothetical protein
LADGVARLSAPDVLALQQLAGHLEEGVAGPLREPVDGGAVDQAREHAAALAKRVSNWREADDNVQICAHALEEEREERILRLLHAGRLASCSNLHSRGPAALDALRT